AYRQVDADRLEKLEWARTLDAELGMVRQQARELGGRIEAAEQARERMQAEHARERDAAAARLRDVQDRLADSDARADAHATHADALEAAMRAVLASTSWKLTRPLRAIMARLRGRDASVSLPERPRLTLRASLPEAKPAAIGDVPALLQGLHFPEVASPQVTIVVPTYGKLEYT